MQIEITKQSEKDFRFLLSRLSHEIRNPVTLINSELQLMASSHPELCSYRQWDSLMDNLEYVKELLKGHTEPVVLHTDQGSVYASKAYNDLIKDSVIVRSMSRSGKPTDNPVNESINGWMKEELFMDFKIEECRRREEFAEVLERYVDFYNNRRPCYAIGYDTPVNYRKRYYRGEIERKNTFEGRSLTEEPKFVAKRRKQTHVEGVSTLKKEK